MCMGRAGAALFLAATICVPLSSRAQLSPQTPGENLPDPLLNEEIVRLPVKVRLREGLREREFVLTTFRPNGPGPFPTVIVSHGRDEQNRARFGRNRGQAYFWVLRGSAVLAPTRVGYGVSGSDIDPESARHSPCNSADFRPLAENALAHIHATAAYAAKQTWIDKENLVLAGASVGGFASVVAAGDASLQVRGVINISGGTGGRSSSTAMPCSPHATERMMALSGKSKAVPSIWIYSANDKYWGSALPRQWHAAYAMAGGKAEFHMLPAFGDNGHDVIGTTEARSHWVPRVEQFLQSLGFAPRKAPLDAPAPTGFALLDDLESLPYVGQRGRDLYSVFLSKEVPRAFAIARTGQSAYFAGQFDVMAKALQRCAELAKEECRLYAVNDNVVWTPDGDRVSGR